MGIKEEFNNIDVAGFAREHPALFAYVREQMARPGKQFLLIGDTNHKNENLQPFLSSPALAALFNHAALAHVCIEAPRESMTPQLLAAYKAHKDRTDAEDSFWQAFDSLYIEDALRHDIRPDAGRQRGWLEYLERSGLSPAESADILDQISRERIRGFKNVWNSPSLGFIHAGLQITAADSSQWKENSIPGTGERFFLGDREVADYIKSQVSNEKAAIIYGAAHFRYDGMMKSRLGLEACVHIDIFPDRESCRPNHDDPLYADILPDMVYIISERALEKPDPARYRAAAARTGDDYQVMKDRVARIYGTDADPAEKAKALAKIEKLPSVDPQYFNYVPLPRGRSPS